jgi:hypothetical protein
MRTMAARWQSIIVCHHLSSCILGILHAISSCGSRPNRVVPIVNQFFSEEGIEVLLLLFRVRALAAGIKTVNDTHSEYSRIHPSRPVLSSQLSLKLQVILSAAIVPINHPTCSIVDFGSLWLRYVEVNSLWFRIRHCTDLSPTGPAVSPC